MEAQQLREIIIKELPILIQNDENFRRIILKISRTQFAGKAETENRIDRMMDMLEIRIKEDAKNWDEQREKWKLHEIERKKELEAQDARWIAEREIQDKKWEENQQVIRNMMVEIQSLNRKHDSTIGALGSRWGLRSEASFRNALKGILDDFPNIEVLNVNEYDTEGYVFGHPDQIELDIIIKNGVLIICEIKSSIGKAEMYIFERKVRFYEKLHSRKASKMIVISPMIDNKAKIVAENLGIETYSYANDVDL